MMCSMELLDLVPVAEARRRFLEPVTQGGSGKETVPLEEAVGRVLQEEVRAGDEVLLPGTLLTPAHVGWLGAAGRTAVEVGRRPRVVILSTGDEVVPPERQPAIGQIRDSNAFSLLGSVRRDGGVPEYRGIVPDRLDALRAGLQEAVAGADMLLVSGGSSMGARDNTARVIDELGSPGVLIHGVTLKPGKPTILAVVDGKPVMGLPGHPVSALLVYSIFGRPAVHHLLGRRLELPRPATLRSRITRSVASAQGREEYMRAVLEEREGELWARPILGKSGLLTTLVQAEGVIRIPFSLDGYQAGDWVDVLRWEED